MGSYTVNKMNQSNNGNTLVGVIAGLAIGLLIAGVAGLNFFSAGDSAENSSGESSEKKPLYWVAPMDANYRRDQPGKSPMGMDLVPVYENTDNEEGKGTIRISPDVINNLGVRTSTVSYQPLYTEINTVGYIAYDEDKLVHIHPRVEGWIEKLHVTATGDPVKKGQALYEIYSPELVNAQEEYLLALNRKNSQLIGASKNRLIALQLPESAIDELNKTKRVKQRITFYSPQNGVVENLKIREGFFVKPGSTLMSIGDLSQVWVEGEVFERQAGQVKVGTPVTMTLDYLPGKSWQGRVDFIYPTLDARTRTIKVRLRFNNDEGYFKPNMFAQFVIHTSDEEEALLIPKEALIRTGNQDRVVLALGEGRFKSIMVKVGRYDNNHVEILEGLGEGEEVVSSAQFLLDSESSKSSDFKRMNHESAAENSESSQLQAADSVWVEAKIESVMAGHKMLTLTHQAIPEWNWPIMTMDFFTTEDIDFSLLKEGLSLHVEITELSNNEFKITNIHIPDENMTMTMEAPNESSNTEEFPSASVTGTIESLMIDHGMITIYRSAIEKWGREPQSVDFIADKGVSLSELSQGMEVEFTFEIRDENFVIVDIKRLDVSTPTPSKSSEASVIKQEPTVDHSHH